MTPAETNKLPIFDRKWFVSKYLEIKTKEQEAYDRERSKTGKKK